MATLTCDKRWPRHAVSYGRTRAPYLKIRAQSANARYTRPIMSYGILLYTFRKGEPVFLLCQRRHTIEFVELILSKVPRERLTSACSRLTEEERKKLSDWTFDDLWDDFLPEKTCKMYFEEKEEMRHKFAKESEGDHLFDSINDLSHPRAAMGIPKGKEEHKGDKYKLCTS
ncbi:NUDIX hydrolase [Golden Marseillevirus]|uniref:NUDIX hydrolase n=1 Tax=Golden Marseillevirus TaxID=1720526 RepID=UPI000877AC12|nr:NUDIX hydrolase [Golden Marseillevirus]ALX27561.1 NUDIX hydrolase [Golden Marseillevirus]